MKKLSLLALVFTLLLPMVPAKPVEAVSASQWDAGFIISDPVFTNANSMSVSQIQSFLNSKMPVCDTWGTQIYSGTTTRAAYGASRGAPAPYTCLKDKTDKGKTASQIIYDAARANNINPQVILVTLQKENSLVTDDWPWPTQYKTAMGYGCPDSTPGQCDAEYHGFKNQVDKAAWQFRRYIDNPGGYNFAKGTRFVRYSPDSSCGGTNVNIRSAGTAALYNYTPYQPNSAAVSSYPGTGNGCSAYGNRNFWYTFNDWFGSSTTGGLYVDSPLNLRGGSLGYGDFDNDGYEDLAIGAPGEDVLGRTDAGSVNVIYGSASGLNNADQQQLYQGSGGISGSLESNDNVGATVSTGDFDNDGYADLAIGAPGEGVGSIDNAGSVNIIYGSASGLNMADQQQFYQEDGGLTGTLEASDMLGAAMTTGDFNNDGRDDLAMGAPGESIGSSSGAGVVNVIFGSASGLNNGSQQQLYQGGGVLLESSEAYDYLGGALAAGDFDNDGRDDLAIGVMGEDHYTSTSLSDAGSVQIIFGSGSGLNPADQQLLFQGAGGITGTLEANDYLGAALAAGDFDNDGRDDLAMGAPGEKVGTYQNAGAVNVIFGAGAGLNMSDQQQMYQGAGGLTGAIELSDFLGASLVTGDFNNDGFADLIMGAPGESVAKRSKAGVIAVTYGSGSGLNLTTQEMRYHGGGLLGVLESGDFLGSTLAAGDSNNDGNDDLVIGSAGEDVNRAVDAGALNIINGSGSGLNSNSQKQLFHSGGGLTGALESGDYVGGTDPDNIFW